ncbi:fused MFS/spermidine synthase [Caballeronia ptereochthonis]|uniref:Spermidine synthase n=1 Tax=Caballeronia ptereochthonis TaxID=1777144 RepID=A0A158B9G0_9BURK|nr:fused MFS/spermidine synthase [Caballeronia ptereochthonis]SAK66722.1 spermidine synthase [Caballeronia ptereochthonis]
MSHLSADHPKSIRRDAARKMRRTQLRDAPVARKAAAPALLLFASGTAALIYQVLWVKQLTLVVGIEVQAVTMAVGAFFAGLALGGWLFGRLADRSAQPFLLYAALEIAALVLGIGATEALAHAAALFATWQASAGALAWALPFALVGLPAVAMGGTLPVLTRALAPSRNHVGGAGGRLYAANTAGAITGALLPAFVLIPLFGVQGSALAAAGLNAVAALGAVALSRGARPSLADTVGADAPRTQACADAGQARVAVALYAVAGGIALGYEVVWSQAIAQFISTRSFAFSIVLATYLLGLALGSAIAARYVDRVRDPWSAFGMLIGVAGLAALGGVACAGRWLALAQRHASALALAATGNLLASMCASFAAAACAIVLVPTLLLGAAFPFALRMAASGGANHAQAGVGADVGRVFALNTAGGIVGTVFAGFVLVPSLGLIRSLGVLAVAAGLIGLAAALSGSVARKTGIAACASVAALSAIVAFATPADRLGRLLGDAHGGSLAYYEESPGGTVAVLEQGDGAQRFRRLYIQGVSNSGDAMTSRRYMRLQALAPLIVHGGTPRSALVIGLGTGITGGALLTWPTLEKRVVAELLPAVVRASSRFDGNYGMSADPRIDVRVADGRRELLSRHEHYDLVTLEPPPPSAAGVVNLYSTDFYRLAEARLNQGGIVAQWLPLATQNEDQTRSLIQSFLQVFPHAALWTTEFHEMMLVGSMQPMPLDVPRIRARLAQPEVARALREVGITSPEAFVATWVADRSALAYYAEDARPVTDDDPRIEYAPWVRRGDFPVTLAHMLALQSEPPLAGADAAFVDTLAAERRTLHAFYRAGLDAYRGDRDAWRRDIGAVMNADRANPYYRWVMGVSD